MSELTLLARLCSRRYRAQSSSAGSRRRHDFKLFGFLLFYTHIWLLLQTCHAFNNVHIWTKGKSEKHKWIAEIPRMSERPGTTFGTSFQSPPDLYGAVHCYDIRDLRSALYCFWPKEPDVNIHLPPLSVSLTLFSHLHIWTSMLSFFFFFFPSSAYCIFIPSCKMLSQRCLWEEGRKKETHKHAHVPEAKQVSTRPDTLWKHIYHPSIILPVLIKWLPHTARISEFSANCWVRFLLAQVPHTLHAYLRGSYAARVWKRTAGL